MRALKPRYKSLFIFIIFLGGWQTQAQPELGSCDQDVKEVAEKQLPKAQKAWASKNYREAERYLEKAVRYDNNYAHGLYLLGDLMIKKKEFLKAEAIYARLLDVCPDYKAEVNYFLGILYIEGNKRQEGIRLLEKFLENPERDFGYDREVKAALKDARAKQSLLANKVEFEPRTVQRISTQADEYLASISPDQQTMYFTRRSRKTIRKDGPAAKLRLVEEFSYSERQENGRFEVGSPMPSPFNQSYNEGGPSITGDNTELYFTVCEDLDGYKNCDIYYSERDAYGYWTTPRSIGDHINTRDAWESQPSVSANGAVLYFTSNRSGGFGGLDLYRIKRQTDGSWSSPEVLPPNINTKKDEKTPFIHSDSRTLYFTSDGLPGMGGFDIFYSRAENDSMWMAPANIGVPINTPEDDLGLFVSLDGKTGYFASNSLRNGNGWDLYAFDLPEQAAPQKVALITGKIESGTEGAEALKESSVQIKNLRTRETVDIAVDQQTGNFARVVSLESEQDYIVTLKKKGAAFNSRYVGKENINEQGVTQTELKIEQLEVGKEYKLNDINFASNSYALDAVSKSVIDEFVIYLEENPDLKADIQGHTDNVGDAASNLTLSRQRAEAVYRYVLDQGISASRLSHHGYGEKRPIASNDTEAGRAQNRRTVFVITSR